MYAVAKINNDKPQNSLYCIPLGYPDVMVDWSTLNGSHWAVLEFDERDLILKKPWGLEKSPQNYFKKYKIKKFKIIDTHPLDKINSKRMLSFFNPLNFNSQSAYAWALNIGNQDIMIDRITESKYAYMWAVSFGDKDVMVDKIVESEWAFWWAFSFPEDRKKMFYRITDPRWSACWVVKFGNMGVVEV